MKPEYQSYQVLPEHDHISFQDELDAPSLKHAHHHWYCTILQRASNAVYLFVGAAVLFILSVGLLIFAIHRQPSEMECAIRLSTYCKYHSAMSPWVVH